MALSTVRLLTSQAVLQPACLNLPVEADVSRHTRHAIRRYLKRNGMHLDAVRFGHAFRRVLKLLPPIGQPSSFGVHGRPSKRALATVAMLQLMALPPAKDTTEALAQVEAVLYAVSQAALRQNANLASVWDIQTRGEAFDDTVLSTGPGFHESYGRFFTAIQVSHALFIGHNGAISIAEILPEDHFGGQFSKDWDLSRQRPNLEFRGLTDRHARLQCMPLARLVSNFPLVWIHEKPGADGSSFVEWFAKMNGLPTR